MAEAAQKSSSVRRILDTRPIGSSQIWIVILVQLVLMIDGLDVQLLGLVTPLILAEWSIDKAAFGLPLAASLFGLAIGAGVGGKLGDTWGRKRVLCVSTLLFGAATFAVAFSSTTVELSFARFVSGLGFGAATPTGIALVVEWLPRRSQANATTFLSVGTPLGGMIGSLGLIGLIPILGWRGAFLVCGAITLAIAVLLMWLLPESALYRLSRGDIRGALDLLNKRMRMNLAEIDISTAPKGSNLADQAQRSIFERQFLRLNFGGWLSFFAAQFIAYSIISWAPTFLSQSGFSLHESLQAAFGFNLMAVLAALLTGFLIARFGSGKVLNSASLLCCVVAILLGLELEGSSSSNFTARLWPTLLSVAGLGLFTGICVATNYAILTLGFPEGVRATGLGFALMIGRLGGMCAGLAGGRLLSIGTNQTCPFFASLVLMALITLLGSLVVDRHIRAIQAAVGH